MGMRTGLVLKVKVHVVQVLVQVAEFFEPAFPFCLGHVFGLFGLTGKQSCGRLFGTGAAEMDADIGISGSAR